MAEYILSILRSQLMIVFSWGANSFIGLENGLKFKVQGFKHNGWVKVLYNEATDLFDIEFIDFNDKTVKKTNGVFFDELLGVGSDIAGKLPGFIDYGKI